MSKASGADGIPVELFQILKDDAVKCFTKYTSKFGKLSSFPQHWKRSVFIQSKRKAIPKNVQTTTQWHLSHRLAK